MWVNVPGIRSRLAILVTGALAVGMTLTTLYLVDRERRAQLDETQRRAGALLHGLSVPVALAIAQSRLEGVDALIAEVVAKGEPLQLRSLAVLDSAGRAVAGYDRAPDGLRADAGAALPLGFRSEGATSRSSLWRRETCDGMPCLLVSMPAVSGLRWGTLVAVFDLSRMETRIAQTSRLMILGAFFVGLLLIFVLVTGLLWTVVRPVKRLAAAARAIRQGDRGVRVGLRRRDELGELSLSFDEMAQELESYTSTLERRVEERSAEIRAKNRELERLATTDPLTGLLNRRAFDAILEAEVMRSRRAGHPFTLMVADIDHFKRFNDTNGHLAGDAALIRVARSFEGCLRATDRVCRWGGEEFLILLLDTDVTMGRAAADKLVERIRHAAIPGEENQPGGRLTVSIGLVSCPAHGTELPTLLARADEALYDVKAAGRDHARVWVGPESGSAPSDVSDISDSDASDSD